MHMHEAKFAVLEYLAKVPEASAPTVATALALSVPAAGMQLLRCVRGCLASRSWDPRTGTYIYAITSRGQARVKFFAARRA